MTKGIVLLMIVVLASVTALGFYVRPVHGIIWIEGHITSDTTWTPVDTYRVIDDTYVDPGVTLTIEPGVRVEFADGFSLIIEGSLEASGTGSNQIVFTSSRSSPSPGVWKSIRFRGSLDERFLIAYGNIKHAVHGITVESQAPAIIEHCEIANCSESGIMLVGKSNVTIRENIIRWNRNGISTAATENSRVVSDVTIINNTLSHNSYNGIYLFTLESIYNIAILFNTFSASGRNGIDVGIGGLWGSTGELSNVTISSNTVSSNYGDGVIIHSYGRTFGDGNIRGVSVLHNTVSANGQHGIYLRTTDMGVMSNVTILSNVVSFNQGNGIYLEDDPFYSGTICNVTISDNAVSTNGGNGIYLRSPGSGGGYGGHLNDVTISHNIASSNGANGISLLTAHSVNVVLFENKISANSGNGINVYRVNTEISNNLISYNVYGVSLIGSQDNQGNHNDICYNTYGMSVVEGANINAENNYWGHSSGPYHASLNPEGEGNPVNGDGTDLDFIPFLTSPIGTINQRPVAILGIDKASPYVNETVTFDASGSSDDGRIDYYFFDFDDGTNSSWTSLPVVTHKYSQEGKHNATLIVMDDFGVTSLDGDLVHVEITVIPEFPPALILPLFMIISMLAVLFAKKRFPTKLKT